jgi:hypothetical protein
MTDVIRPIRSCRTSIDFTTPRKFRLSHDGLVASPFAVPAYPPPSARRRSRGRQCDGKRIAADDHHQDQPPDRSLAVGILADKLGDVSDGRGLSLDLPPLAG